MLSLFNESMNEVSANGTMDATAQLTAQATTVVNTIMKTIENCNEDEELTSKVKASMQSHEAMDKLINELVDLKEIGIYFLSDIDEAALDRMMKSQQSKRSRSKSKAMTVDNYRTMMTGAVAENLIRLVTGKGKSLTTGVRVADISFTTEDLEKLSMNQEELRKSIRNIQSKKSIMKSKANFDEASDRWQQLLVAEEQLKNIRTVATPASTKAVETNSRVLELLSSVESIDSLKAADAKSLLETIKAAIGQ